VKKIVEDHGGDVAIVNAAPQGARVTITLPTASAKLAQNKSAA
jgi:nitrogen fixation/metabolism regulation signal transduction histidine kinase